MKSEAPFTRPSLTEALDAWTKVLAERGLATDFIWIFAENLCVEKPRGGSGDFHFGYQMRFTPPPEDALDVAFEHFTESDKPMVFYRLGERAGKSVCALLCDAWFEHRGKAGEFLRRDEWRMMFYPGPKEEIEEVTDLSRWLRRVKRDRAFHDLDFCMALEAIDEIKAYGRVLMPYERMGAAMLGRLRRFLGQPA
jgi:hypothetical protein